MALALLALCSVLVVACGAESAPKDDAPEPKRATGSILPGGGDLPYTGDQVFRLFYSHGLYLIRGDRYDRITLNSVATPQQRDAVIAEWGYFHVSIAKESSAIDLLLSDPNTGEPLQPDGRGIYWYLEPELPGIPAAWFALKRYENVVAAWLAGGEQRTDEKWDRLDSVLARLPGP